MVPLRSTFITLYHSGMVQGYTAWIFKLSWRINIYLINILTAMLLGYTYNTFYIRILPYSRIDPFYPKFY